MERTELQAKLDQEKARLDKVQNTFDILGDPKRVARNSNWSPKYGTGSHLDWEVRAENLARLGHVRESLRDFSIPKIETNIAQLNKQRQLALALECRDKIVRAASLGLIPESEVSWINSIIEKLAPLEPAPQTKKDDEINVTFPNIQRFIEPHSDYRKAVIKFMHSPRSAALLESIKAAFESSDSHLIKDSQRSQLHGLAFEYLAHQECKGQIFSRLGYEISITAPKETFELYKLAFPEHPPHKDLFDINEGYLPGISAVDGFIIRRNQKRREIIGFTEYSMSDVKVNEQKQKQLDHYVSNAQGVKDSIARMTDSGARNYSPEANKLLREILKMDPDDPLTLRRQLMIFYIQPKDGSIVDQLEPNEVYKLPHINTSDIWNFVGALVEDCKNLHQLTGDVSREAIIDFLSSKFLIISEDNGDEV